MKTRVSVLSLFFTVLLSGCADVFSEPEASDILSELIILHTGEIVMIHRGGCNDFEKSGIRMLYR